MRKIIIAGLGLILLISTIAIAIGTAGSKDDPLITVSYLEDKFMPSLENQMSDKADTAFNAALGQVDSKLKAVADSEKIPVTDDEVIAALAGKLVMNGGGYKSVSFVADTLINGKFGMRIIIEKGSAQIVSGGLINLTDGKEIKSGTYLKPNFAYLVPETSDVSIKVLENECQAKVSGSFTETKPPKPREVQYTAYADALKTLGLFKGTEKGYELHRPSTRIEGLVMLIRLLGEEKDALEFKGSHPFNDVLSWSDRYVAYAYNKGYTKGSTAKTFGGKSQMTAPEYMTFLLRALEYNDSNGDFSWNESLQKSVQIGLISSDDKNVIESADKFYRDHIVFTSYKALFAEIKGGSLQLSQKLLGKGAIKQENLDLAKEKVEP